MKPVATLSISLKQSQRLLSIQILAHVVACIAVLGAAIPPWLAVVLLLATCASLVNLRKAASVSGLVLKGDGRLETVGVDGMARDALAHPHTLVLSFLIVLLYWQEGRLRSLTLLSDCLAVEDFRQLRLWLRWRSAGSMSV